MKRALFCIVAIFGSGAVCTAGPYTIRHDGIVKIDPWYQTATPIGGGYSGLDSIEYSQDGWLYGVNPLLDTLERIDPTTRPGALASSQRPSDKLQQLAKQCCNKSSQNSGVTKCCAPLLRT